jgi:hypothetical protein
MRRTFRLSRSVLAKTEPAKEIAPDLRTLPQGAILELLEIPAADPAFAHVIFNGEKFSVFQADLMERSVEIKASYPESSQSRTGDTASAGGLALDKDT